MIFVEKCDFGHKTKVGQKLPKGKISYGGKNFKLRFLAKVMTFGSKSEENFFESYSLSNSEQRKIILKAFKKTNLGLFLHS